ncbi:hypothetical protein SAMN05216251_115115 [Actinacidiphila alni]|uniref:Uncharacterized protein n=1 Tax=Actinacidiphila alni TaxID=380248 RepID=A0A1I2J066_9ACTN|nr:hypothetical protein [Actinacidiphila alni]SFF47388.1 hypothetical protein SAMN05216251_115115 [Actinacidiphila alni]
MIRLLRAGRTSRGDRTPLVTSGGDGVYVVHREGALPDSVAAAAHALRGGPPGHITVVVVADSADRRLDDAVCARVDAIVAKADRTAPGTVLRLAMSAGAAERPGHAAPARRICEKWGIDVLAPAGAAMLVPGGTLFAPGGPDAAGGWWRFSPGTVPRRLGVGEPAPDWQQALDRARPPEPEGHLVERVPAGLLIRSAAEASPDGADSVRYAVPADTARPALIVGVPGTPPVTADALAAVVAALPGRLRGAVRLLPGDGRDLLVLGQRVADLLGVPTHVVSGLPVLYDDRPAHGAPAAAGARVVHVGPDGTPLWQPYVEAVVCEPAGTAGSPGPRLAEWRPPVPGLARDPEPGVMRLNRDWQVAVTRSGLRVDRRGQGPALSSVNARPVRPEVMTIDIGLPGQPLDDSLTAVLDDLFAALEDGPRERGVVRLHGTLSAEGHQALRRVAVRHGLALGAAPADADDDAGSALLAPLPEPVRRSSGSTAAASGPATSQRRSGARRTSVTAPLRSGRPGVGGEPPAETPGPGIASAAKRGVEGEPPAGPLGGPEGGAAERPGTGEEYGTPTSGIGTGGETDAPLGAPVTGRRPIADPPEGEEQLAPDPESVPPPPTRSAAARAEARPALETGSGGHDAAASERRGAESTSDPRPAGGPRTGSGRADVTSGPSADTPVGGHGVAASAGLPVVPGGVPATGDPAAVPSSAAPHRTPPVVPTGTPVPPASGGATVESRADDAADGSLRTANDSLVPGTGPAPTRSGTVTTGDATAPDRRTPSSVPPPGEALYPGSDDDWQEREATRADDDREEPAATRDGPTRAGHSTAIAPGPTAANAARMPLTEPEHGPLPDDGPTTPHERAAPSPGAPNRTASEGLRAPAPRVIAHLPVAPGRLSVPSEHLALRGLLGGRWDRHASAVERALTALPGLRAAADRGLGPDLVAVHAYLTAAGSDGRDEDEHGLNDAWLTAALGRRDGRALAYLCCLASGLNRLPSYRGVAARPAGVLDAGSRLLLPGEELAEPGPVAAATVAKAYPAMPDDHYLFWSATGRRVASLTEPGPGPVSGPAEVVFGPGSRFRVLKVTERAGATVILLRELAAGAPPSVPGRLDASDTRVLDRLLDATELPTAQGTGAEPAVRGAGVLGLFAPGAADI